MSNSQYKRIGLHILFWLLYFLYDTVDTSWGGQDYFDFTQIHKVWANIPSIICVAYINLYVLMPKFLYPKRYGLYVLTLTGLVVVWAFMTRYIGYHFWLAWDQQHNYEQYLTEPKTFFVPIRIARNAFRLYPVLALTMMIKVLRNNYSNEKQLRAVESERHQAELMYLKAQIHPHFFFNTLNSLYSLTLKKSDKAPDIVMRMSGLMHYMLYEINTDSVLLEEEIALLKNYIAIEELRFGDRIEYSFQSSGLVGDKRISPLLLLPFVENAFKHSLSNELNKAWVTVNIKLSGPYLYFIVENSFTCTNVNKPHQGIGLANVKKRLELAYPNRHELKINETDNVFSINLKLQLS